MNGSEPFGGAEKRRSQRLRCEGSVDIREEGCDVRTWARFSDISMHGCYVESQATYPVGTILYMKLDANGVRVEAKGTVKVNYPYLAMGIAFLELSDENRVRLRELLGTIRPSCFVVGPGAVPAAPAAGPMVPGPAIADPGAAVNALVAFFRERQTLTREEFVTIVRKSQSSEARR